MDEARNLSRKMWRYRISNLMILVRPACLENSNYPERSAVGPLSGLSAASQPYRRL